MIETVDKPQTTDEEVSKKHITFIVTEYRLVIYCKKQNKQHWFVCNNKFK